MTTYSKEFKAEAIRIRGLYPFAKPISALRSLPGVAILRCGKSNSIISQFVIL